VSFLLTAIYADVIYADCLIYAECHMCALYADCHMKALYADCRMNALMLSVVMLNVVVPCKYCCIEAKIRLRPIYNGRLYIQQNKQLI